jgi:hypothetical protein
MIDPSPDVSRIGVARPQRWVCHRVTAGGCTRGVLEQYAAGSDTRGRPGGRSYLRSQQAIREISVLIIRKYFIEPGIQQDEGGSEID